MGKPPTTDQELSARVAALEERADTTDAAVAELTSGLDTAEADISLLIDRTDALDARVTALEGAATIPEPPVIGGGPILPPARPDNTLPTPEPQPPEVTPPTTGRAAIITQDGVSHIFTQEGGKDLGAYTDPQGRFVQHCYCATCDTLPGFRVVFRPDADGTREEVVFELGEIWPTAPADALGAYTATITKDGETLATVEAPAHHYFSRWRWQSAPRAVRTDAADLIARKLVPNYQASVGRGFTWPSDARTYAGPMDLAGIQAYMPSTGDRDDIGVVTEATGDWLCTQSPIALSSMMAWLEGGGSLPWHYRDEKTGAPLDPFAHPKATTNNPYDGDPYIPLYGSSAAATCDIAHEPDLAYVPYLLTGDPYALEELQFAVTYNVVCQPWNSRCYNYYQAQRAHAWGLRTMARCCVITPDDVPRWLLPKSHYRRLMDGNLEFTSAFADSPDDPHHSLCIMETAEGGMAEGSCPADTVISPWMEDFEAAVLGHIIELGFDDWRPIYTWFMQNLVARCGGNSGWPQARCTNYRYPVRLARDQPYATSWAEAWQINLQLGYMSEPADPNHLDYNDTSYPSYARAALATAKRLGISGAADAFAWLDSELEALLASNTTIKWRWCIA